MRTIPEALRSKLPPPLRGFRWQARSYLVQIYYHQPAVHFEVWSIRRLGHLEISLHFENEDRSLNEALFRYFDQYIIEIKAQLGERVELERWDRGWARLYESIPLPSFSQRFAEEVASRLAQMIIVLYPYLEETSPTDPL